MKALKWFLLAVVVVLGLALAVRYRSRQQTASPPTPSPRAMVAPAAAPGPALAESPAPASVVEAPAMAPESPAGPTEPVTAAPAPADLAMIPVGTTTPLAKVNGVEITLKDLMPLNAAAATPQDLRADAFAQLLGLAIEREIIFQAAQAQGVELTDEHRQSLEEVRSAALARANAPYVLPGYDAEAQAAFEVRAESARMLEDVLLGASPIVYRPASPEDVETYYESHKAEFGKLPKNPAAREQAWQAIVAEIRSRLAYASSTEREQRRNQLLEELKAQAAIERLAPGSIPESPQPH